MGVKGGIPPVKGGVQCPAPEAEYPGQANRRAGCEFTCIDSEFVVGLNGECWRQNIIADMESQEINLEEILM